MQSRIHRTWKAYTLDQSARLMAERVYRKLQLLGTRQVRLYHGIILTYPHPVKRGYGTRGLLVGIYTLATHIEWIEEDLMQVLTTKEMK